MRDSRIAVLLPCRNEALTIAKVVSDFRRALPEATIYVYDNDSSDGSAKLAADAGAIVRMVSRRGKGTVLRRMFRDIDADVYVMADSDDTYPADEVQKLVDPVLSGVADMVSGDRMSSTYASENKRMWHNFGNRLVRALINRLWGQDIKDVMTGYRAFSRLFVKTCPILSEGFEVETEMTIHAIDKRMAIVEIPVNYRDRPKGSYSKLNTVMDGIRVLGMIHRLFRLYKPLSYYGFCACVLLLTAGGMCLPVFATYIETGLVPRLPTLVVGCFMAVAAALCLMTGRVLNCCKKQYDQLFEILAAKQ